MKSSGKLLGVALAGVLAIAACTGDTAEDLQNAASSIPGADQAADQAAELAADVQADMNVLANEIESSEASADLQAAWSDMQAELTTAVASMQADGSIDTAAVETTLDDFQAALDSLGEDVGDELRSAWDSLRSSVQQMLS